MDVEQIKKRQTIKVFITEVIMVFSIIGLVVFLMMIASGYWISQDFTVERQGLLQYASIPTGADVAIDGETGWMQKTNNSKMVSAGEHVVTISKEGYDSWTKRVSIEEGLLYRIAYPRLFLRDRSIEKVKELGDVRYTTVSPDGKKVLVLEGDAIFKLADINSDEIKLEDINISTLGCKVENILSLDWSGDNEKVLMNATTTDANSSSEWILINVKNPEKSIRISKSFDLKISDIKFIDSAADNLLILEYSDSIPGENHLRKINLSSQSVSSVIASNATNMNVFGGEIVFIDNVSNFITSYSNGEAKQLIAANDSNTFVQKSEFYNNKYMSVVSGNVVTLYEEKKMDSMSDVDGFEEKLKEEISFIPAEIKIEKNGDFLFMKKDRQVAVLDMESEKIVEYEIENEKYGWLDGHMIYTIDDAGTLIVYDYDGLNRRELSKNVIREFGATISDNRWLYYVSDGWLVRENLLPK